MPKDQEVIGPYTLIKKIGRGQFGEVWLVEKRTRMGTTRLAAKLLLDETPDLDAIKEEVELWTQASGHTNILPIIEADIYDDQVVIVSEYAGEGSLGKWLKEHKNSQGTAAIDIHTALGLMDGILSGLEHLHSRDPRPIIHRDLKPENILLQGGTPRLADFGLSRVLKSSNSRGVAGTLPYMAPEVFKGNRSIHCDIWAAGVILYQLICGQLPFDRRDEATLIHAILYEDPVPPSSDAYRQVAAIIERALQKDLALRYQSTAEMRRDVNAIRWRREASLAVATADGRNVRPTIAEAPVDVEEINLESRTINPLAATETEVRTTESTESRVTNYSITPKPTTRRWPRVAAGVFAVLVVAAILFVEFGLKSASHYLEAGKTAFAHNDYNAAIAQLGKAIEMKPANPEAYHYRGWAKARLNQYSEAIRDYDQAISLNAQYAAAYSHRGYAYERLGNRQHTDDDWKQALTAAEEEVRANPKIALVYVDRGRAYIDLRKYDEALADLSQAIKIDQGVALAYKYRGDTYYDQQKFDQAISDYSEAIRLDPNSATAYVGRGNCRKQTELEQRISDYTEAIRLDPNCVIAYDLRAPLYFRLRKYDEAISDFSAAIRLEPNQAGYYVGRGLVYSSQKKFAEANVDYTEAIRLKPDEGLAYLYRGNDYDSQDKFDQAISDFNQAIRLDPDEAGAYSSRCNTLIRQNKTSEAINDCNQAIKLDPQNSENYYLRGGAYDLQKKYNLGIKDYSDAIRLKPDYLNALLHRSLDYTRVKQYDRAIIDSSELLRLDPKNVDGYVSRGYAYDDQNKHDLAIADFTKAIELRPSDAGLYNLRAIAYKEAGQHEKEQADRAKVAELKGTGK